MHALEPDDAARVLQMSDLRARAVKAFNDNEMARAITGLRGGRLLHKLQWLKAEGSSLALVWPLIADTRTPSEERIELYQHNEMRSFFVDLCNDDEMASVVDLLGGSLEARLNWMFAEGTSWKAVIQKVQATPDFRERAFLFTKDYMRENFVSLLNNGEMAALVDMLHGTLDQKLGWMAAEGTNGNLVFPKVRAAPDPELRDVKPATRQAVNSELSAKDFRRFEQMLDEGLLFWEEVSKPVTERHYEQKDEKDPTSGYKIKKFEWTSRYEILYMRTALRIRVRICFSGEKATDTHKRMWLNGIHNRWNGKFHLENDRRMALVFEPIFVTSDEHQTVKLHKGPPVARADMTNWTAGPNANGARSTRTARAPTRPRTSSATWSAWRTSISCPRASSSGCSAATRRPATSIRRSAIAAARSWVPARATSRRATCPRSWTGSTRTGSQARSRSRRGPGRERVAGDLRCDGRVAAAVTGGRAGRARRYGAGADRDRVAGRTGRRPGRRVRLDARRGGRGGPGRAARRRRPRGAFRRSQRRRRRLSARARRPGGALGPVRRDPRGACRRRAALRGAAGRGARESVAAVRLTLEPCGGEELGFVLECRGAEPVTVTVAPNAVMRSCCPRAPAPGRPASSRWPTRSPSPPAPPARPSWRRATRCA